MKLFHRTSYLKKLRPFYDSDLIKVVTGIRRCGKSCLLKTVIEEAPEGAIVLLTAGQTYDYSSETIDLTKAVTVKAAPGGAKPRLYLKSFILGGTTETSSSMPLVSQIVEADGKLLLDGGTSDSVPLLHSMLTGASKHIVVLTQAAGYKKKPNKLMALMRQRYADYPYYLDRLQYRHYEYNRLYRWIEREQAAGRIFVIRPPEPVTVSSMEHDADKLLALYEQGLATAAQAWPKLQEYLAG